MKPIHILAIESSCDDTSAAVLFNGKILSNVTATQDIHKLYGGVVPEVASRQHLQSIVPVIDTALSKASVTKDQLNAIAFTRGPGLMGSLLVGTTMAKALGASLDIPLIEVHHMQAHVMAHFAEDPHPRYPFLCLTISGGHTQILDVTGPNQMNIIGTTVDDAAGEAFDKCGKMLGLDYPAGPAIDKLAKKGNPIYPFPEPNVGELDFSFSGLKTSFLYFLRSELSQDPDFINHNIANLAASIQDRIVSILMNRLIKATNITEHTDVAIAGGVSANSHLRLKFELIGSKMGWNTFIPNFQYCTDNAGMIAVSAYYKYLAKEFAKADVVPDPRMSF